MSLTGVHTSLAWLFPIPAPLSCLLQAAALINTFKGRNNIKSLLSSLLPANQHKLNREKAFSSANWPSAPPQSSSTSALPCSSVPEQLWHSKVPVRATASQNPSHLQGHRASQEQQMPHQLQQAEIKLCTQTGLTGNQTMLCSCHSNPAGTCPGSSAHST